ncbi:peptidoglycan editing factor PgeF [Amylibacter sp.]|nr:peptidoglycan editing factor PgeF [Amylibacter sp.]
MTLQIITSDRLASHKHGFFTRHGGVSSGIFKGLNCGAGSSDQSDAVTKNKSLVCDAMGVPLDKLMTVHQIHSADVIISLEQETVTTPKADAIVSKTKGLAIGILTADCAPILFCDQTAGVIGAAHSGWQGAIKGIAQNTIKEMTKLGADISNIQAIVGPCISQKNYEVGEDFLETFLLEDQYNMRFFANGKTNKYHFDLPGFCLQSLRNSGITNPEWTGHCTYEDSDKFYSYRKSTHLGEPDYGRLISVITL